MLVLFARALRDRASAPTSLASAFKMPVAAVCVIHLKTSLAYVWDILLVAAIGLLVLLLNIAAACRNCYYDVCYHVYYYHCIIISISIAIVVIIVVISIIIITIIIINIMIIISSSGSSTCINVSITE